MRKLHLSTVLLTAVIAVGSLTGAAVPTPHEPPPSCGTHVQVTRKGNAVRVVGTELYRFIPAGHYGLSYAYEDNGKAHGGYNASPNSGMNYSFDAYKSTAQTFRVAIFNEAENLEYCAGNYRA